MLLGEHLARLRKGADLTVIDVVERLQVPRSTVYWWEAAGRPAAEQLQRLLDLYQASDVDRLEAWRLRALPVEDATPTPTT